MIDERIVNLGIEIDGVITWYKDYAISASGTKVSSSMAAECNITILGLKKETRNQILQACKPGISVARKRVRVYLDVGRQSYGASTYYAGDVFRAKPTTKPDLGVQMRCLVGWSKKNSIVQRGGLAEYTSLRQIATWVAEDNGLKLSYEINDKQIRSYAFTGSAQEAIFNLELLSNSEVFVDNETLYVKNTDAKAKGRSIFQVNAQNGSLISAEATETGVVVNMMFHPDVTVGSVIDLESEIDPSINGQYTVFKAGFNVSKRSTEFYLKVEASARV
jgi:hypothetical protein